MLLEAWLNVTVHVVRPDCVVMTATYILVQDVADGMQRIQITSDSCTAAGCRENGQEDIVCDDHDLMYN